MPKKKPSRTEEKAPDLTTNPGGRPPEAAVEVPMPKLVDELAHLLAQALAKRWLDEHDRPVLQGDEKPGGP